MKRLVLIVVLLTSINVFGQKNFDYRDFTEKTIIAEWLYEYDAIAWWTSDSIIAADSTERAKLGSEWFCFKTDDNNWHAVYGKYENDSFNLVFHYLVDTAYSVKRVFTRIDTTILNGYSRALITANEYIKQHTDSVNLRFNQYIKRNTDKSYSVYILSAFQPNGWAVYGKEFILTVDKNGNAITKDESYLNTDFKGFEVREIPREVWIDQTNLEKPTLGIVFFVWYYKKYFTKINIDNKYSITTTLNNNGMYNWIHIVKDKKTLKKENKKRKNKL